MGMEESCLPYCILQSALQQAAVNEEGILERLVAV
jgi:hypothetical protein